MYSNGSRPQQPRGSKAFHNIISPEVYSSLTARMSYPTMLAFGVKAEKLVFLKDYWRADVDWMEK
jgi:hypothetical protein